MSGAYLDHAATTPMRPESAAAMAPLLGDVFGNPSGSHRWAREARRRLDDARDLVAEVLGARPGEIVFTSGGTEADNLAVTGVLGAVGGRAVCSAVEHHAVLEPVLASGGATVAVDAAGCVDLDALSAALRSHGPPVSLVSVMLANNEVGTVQSIDEVAATVSEASPGTVIHTDAVAAAPWFDVGRRGAAAQLVSVSGHKVGGPKGIGVLVVRDGTALVPLLRGGGQERERRSGTPDVAGAVGLAAALVATAADREATGARIEALRRRLVDGILAAVPGAISISPPSPLDRTPGTVNLCFPGVDREALLFLLDQGGIGASWGSSCSSGATEPSHVLAAMGVAAEQARGALRLSLGWCSTATDVEAALAVVPAAVARLRSSTPPATGDCEPAGLRATAASAAEAPQRSEDPVRRNQDWSAEGGHREVRFPRSPLRANDGNDAGHGTGGRS